MRGWSQIAGVVALVGLLSMATGCADDPESAATRTVHADGDGPLSASSARGGKALLAPPGAESWTGTFGGLLLCATETSDIVLESVSHTLDPNPVRVRDFLRLVPAASEQTGDELTWAPIYGSVGQYQDLTTKHRGQVVPVADHRIEQQCQDGDEEGFTELLVEVDVNRAGGAVRETTIDYKADGDAFQLVVPWQMVACGSAITDPQQCPR